MGARGVGYGFALVRRWPRRPESDRGVDVHFRSTSNLCGLWIIGLLRHVRVTDGTGICDDPASYISI